ncbi:fungal-specific transcription factor domain-containing protein [Aspergillus granulosus]|uniref:Fungal-specific transcription factor domain-containing protein n=1 Tax=Aspergillus granulosus TaxID=176169 RepID=A0ABR4HE16_9EURO
MACHSSCQFYHGLTFHLKHTAMADLDARSSETSIPRNSRRRRAAQACLYCRKRKVRCDVAAKGQPCTNCSLDNTACEVKRRQQRRQLDVLVTPPATSSTLLSPSDSTTRLTSKYEDNIQLASALETSAGFKSSRGMPIAADIQYFLTPNDIHSNDSTVKGTCDRAKDLQDTDGAPLTEAMSLGNIVGDIPGASNPSTATSQATDPWTEWTNYRFIHAKIGHDIPEWDVILLQQRGCFSLPVRGLLNEFIREYFLHVHPSLPVINEADFWDTYTHSRREPISLMLFQAMLFAASSFVSQSSIKRLGFKSLRASRASFYNRAKTLYDLEIHPDDFCCAQTALLLTYYSSPTNPNINSYWLTVALHHARVIHAARYYELNHHEKANLLKRIWWACVCRDRLLSLGLRRPFQIGAHEFDFRQSALTISDLSDEIHRSLVYSANNKRALIQLFNFQCELCVALTSGLILLSPLSVAAVVTQEHLSNGIDELLRWHQHTQGQLDFLVHPGMEHDSTVLFKSLLLIYYHSAQLALQNHAIYLEITRHADCSAKLDSLMPRVSEHIRGITDCLLELGQRNLLGYLPITTAANITLPLTWYMIGTQVSSMESSGNTSHAHQLIYSRAFKILQMQYEGTDQVLDYIHKIINQLRSEARSTRRIANRQRTNGSGPRVTPNLSSRTTTGAEESAVIIYSLAHCPPGEYVRISKTIDVSLAMGRFPDHVDLPIPPQLLKPVVGTSPYCPLAFRLDSEAFTSKWAQVVASDAAELSEPSIEPLLGDYDQWDIPAYEDSAISSIIPADNNALVLQSADMEDFRTPEAFNMFSGTSAEDLESLFPHPSAVDSREAAENEAMINIFPFD